MSFRFSNEDCRVIIDLIHKIIGNTENLAEVMVFKNPEIKDCPAASERSVDYALKLVEMLGMPEEVLSDLRIEEVPLCWDEAVSIIFSVNMQDRYTLSTWISRNTYKLYFELAIEREKYPDGLCNLMCFEVSLKELGLN